MVSFNRRIVRILEEGGHVDMQVLAEASQIAAKGEGSVTDYLVEKNICEEPELRGILANRLGVPPIDLSRVESPQDMIEVVSLALAGETQCVPISKMGGILTIAVSNPFDVVKHDDLRLATGCDLRLALALETQVTQAQKVLYDTVELRSGLTWYTRLGDAPFILLLLAVLGGRAWLDRTAARGPRRGRDEPAPVE